MLVDALPEQKDPFWEVSELPGCGSYATSRLPAPLDSIPDLARNTAGFAI